MGEDSRSIYGWIHVDSGVKSSDLVEMDLYVPLGWVNPFGTGVSKN